MKRKKIKIQIVFFALLFSLLLSCGNEGGSGDLAGTWRMTDLEFSGSTTTDVGGFPINATYTAIGTSYTYEITLNSNNNRYSATGGFNFDATVTIGVLSQTDSYASGNVSSNGTWSRNGNELVFQANNGDVRTTNILDQTSNTIIVDFVDLFDINSSLPAGTTLNTAMGTITLVK